MRLLGAGEGVQRREAVAWKITQKLPLDTRTKGKERIFVGSEFFMINHLKMSSGFHFKTDSRNSAVTDDFSSQPITVL